MEVAYRRSPKTFEVGWDEGCLTERLRKRPEPQEEIPGVAAMGAKRKQGL